MPPEMLASAVTASFKSSKPDTDVKRAKRKLTPRSATGIDAYIGARMRERRLLLEISQDRLGKEQGVSFQQIQKYESGQNRVSAAASNLERLAVVHV